MGKAKGRHKAEQLTAAFCAKAKPGRHTDGHGLYLVVAPTGAKRWLQRIVIGGKRRDLGLGSYPAVPLADAREKALANEKEIEAGGDPLEAKRQAEAEAQAVAAVPTFSTAVDDYLQTKLAEFKNEKHKAQWRSTLDTYAGPVLGALPVDKIDVQDVMRVLRPIWAGKTETASRLRGRIEAVLQAATVAGHRSGANPAFWRGNLEFMLPKPSKVARPDKQPALSLDDAPAWFADLRDRDGLGARALEFLALTASRSGEVRGATWQEIDLARGIWTIPAARMKAEREHRVALSPDALALLESLPRFAGNPLVFPAHRGGMLSDMTLSAVMRRMHESKLEADQAAAGAPLPQGVGGWHDPRNGRPAVPHGLRSVFRDWVAERTHFPGDLAEVALAHKISNAVEAAYRRGDMIEKRRAMMAAWAGFLTGAEAANVVPLVARA